MKALGIIRNIDDLGRVVIPKEVRRTQGWDNGQPMEMFIDGDKLVMQGYGKVAEKQEAISKLKTLMKTAPEYEGKLISSVIEYIEG